MKVEENVFENNGRAEYFMEAVDEKPRACDIPVYT